MKEMKSDKADGGDGVQAEIIEATDKFGTEKLTELANRMHDTGNIPENMMENLFISIPKKPGTVEYKEHRTIVIMSDTDSD